MAVSELPGNPTAVWTVRKRIEGNFIYLFLFIYFFFFIHLFTYFSFALLTCEFTRNFYSYQRFICSFCLIRFMLYFILMKIRCFCI